MKYTSLSLFLALLCPVMIFSQQETPKFTLSGYVKDASSGETLIGAYVVAKPADDPETASPPYAITNEYGFYSMTIPEGNYTVIASYVQSTSEVQQLSLQENTRLNLSVQTSQVLKEVVITDKREDGNVTGSEMGKFDLKPSEVENIPVLFGEADILKTLQLLPGIQSAGEGNAGFYVRGGGPDQNLILLDEAVVYNSGHLFGFFSIFNSDAIKNTSLIKGGMPAEFGGRLSSVLDISMKDGNEKEWHGKGGIGLISSKLTLEGPLVKDKSSLMLSGRRTYIDVLMKPFVAGTGAEGSGYYFYDFNAKASYRFSDKDRIYLSGYFGRDVFTYNSDDSDFNLNIPWGNATTTLRWNHLFSDKLFMNAYAIYNDYQFEVGAGQEDLRFSLFSGIRDYNAATDFYFFPGNNHNLKFGANYTYHRFTPGALSLQADDVQIDPDDLRNKFAHEAAIYIQDEFDWKERWRFNFGLRGSFFRQMGPYVYKPSASADSVSFDKGEPVQDYFGLEPRASSRFQINEQSSLKASVAVTNQYIHLVTNSGSTLPTDIWVPSSRVVEPQRGIQYALGYFRNLAKNKYETSVEVYYKDLQNQIEFNQYYIPELSSEIEKDFVFGDGESYGVELFLKKRTGRLNGWIGYTWSRTFRTFKDLNQGKEFPARYDRRHDLSVVAIYELHDRWTVSGTFVYGSGIAFTLPESYYFINSQLALNYGEINSARLKPYHRADISATLHGKKDKKFRSDWVFSIYNVYNRKNPYIIYLDYDGNLFRGDAKVTPKQISLFPIIPSISWNFKF
ncbi:MAG: TonB-dependent receptor [Bacteroidia bacterium]